MDSVKKKFRTNPELFDDSPKIIYHRTFTCS